VLLAKLLDEDARRPLAELGRRALQDGTTIHWESKESNRWDWNRRIATALGLRAVLAVDRSDPRIGPIVRWLMLHRRDSFWWSTRDTSWVLAALADYLAGERASNLTGDVRVLLNGRLVQTYRLTPDQFGKPDFVLRLGGSTLRPGGNTVTIERGEGTSRVFYSAVLRQTIAMDNIPALSTAGMSVAREYLRVLPKKVGQDTWTLQTEPTRGQLRQGDQILVRLTVKAPRDVAYVVLEDPFPAGLEPTDRGTADVDEWRYWWTYTDVRDDRIAFFARTLPAGEHVFEYYVRAQSPGTFAAMPAIVQGMYNPETHGETASSRVVVRP
jgi:hypothetical protein